MAKTTKSINTVKIKQIDIARELYLGGMHSQGWIAEQVGISENTFKAWREKYRWEEIRGAVEGSKSVIIANYLRRMAKLSEIPEDDTNINHSANADAGLKYVKIIDTLSPTKISISGELDLLRRFTTYLYDQNPKLAKEATPLIQSFGKTRVHEAIGK
jgi:hypothetical protein